MKKTVKSILISLILLIPMVSCQPQWEIYPIPGWPEKEPEKEEPVEIKVESISIDESLVLEIGETKQLTVSFTPAGTTGTVNWTSSDDLIATVDPATGVIRAIKAGSAIITATLTETPEITATCNLTVDSSITVSGDKSLADILTERGLTGASELSLAGTLSENDFATLKGMENLETLDISGIENTEIPANAFEGANFSTITLPDSLLTIGNAAFKNSSITVLNIPYGVTLIADDALEGCEDLKSIAIPVTAVGNLEEFLVSTVGLSQPFFGWKPNFVIAYNANFDEGRFIKIWFFTER